MSAVPGAPAVDPRHGYAAADVRAAEQPLLDAGVPLMRRAAAALAAAVRRELDARATRPGSVLLLVGPGDNGGDALYAGAELAVGGAEVIAIPVTGRWHAGAAAEAQRRGVRFADAAGARAIASRAEAIVDGIVGTGSTAGLRGTARDAVAAILPVLERADRPVVIAADLPSGIGADDGAVPDPVVLPADITVTFGAVKAGLLREPARSLAGRVELVDLGLAPYLPAEPLVRSGSTEPSSGVSRKMRIARPEARS